MLSKRLFARPLLLCSAIAIFCTSLPSGSGISAPPAACTEEIVVPQPVSVAWLEVARDAQALLPDLTTPTMSKLLTPQQQARANERLQNFTVKEGTLHLALLGEAMASSYPGMETVPVPVLAPVDAGRLLADAATLSEDQRRTQKAPLASSIETIQFLPGPSGYDAVLTVSERLLRDLNISLTYKPQLHAAGTAMSYGSPRSGDPVAELQALYPDLRRLLGSDEVTYTFRKYGVPYFLNLGCLPVPHQPGVLSCAQADVIVHAVLRDLRLIGGVPVAINLTAPPVVARPTTVSATFKYHPPGKLLNGTSQSGDGKGDTSCKLYRAGELGFPIRLQPVFANSQVFLHSGNCLGQMDVIHQPGAELTHYKCRQNDQNTLIDLEGHHENYNYPWRDNYCEARGGDAGAAPGCPLGRGHAGQDLRPGYCIPARSLGARCKIDVFEVVAIADGIAWWKTDLHENHLRLKMDGGSDKIYFMYLHMSPSSLWNAGMRRGVAIPVKKGQVLGMVGNFEKAMVGGTSTHLHFEIRHGDDIGPTVSPYWTLVRAYELRVNARGVETAE